ncbi:aldehyde dehydrogenase family protein [Nocardia salmonicida]|uniref:aldehyde dehydrogenase family protein n=1 Tax=Nocardia salmonicida TaxID=53431 RepID=UPI0036327A78
MEAAEQQFLETRHPVTGEILGCRPVDDEAAVADAVARARAAAPHWAGIGAEARKAALRRRAKRLIANIDELTGDGATGDALVTAGVDKIAFSLGERTCRLGGRPRATLRRRRRIGHRAHPRCAGAARVRSNAFDCPSAVRHQFCCTAVVCADSVDDATHPPRHHVRYRTGI